jgi:hypothetical protein
MNQTEIYNACEGKISRTAIIDRDGEYVIRGKCCIAAPEDNGIWDIWICNEKNLAIGLGQKKVRNTIRTFQSPIKVAFRELTGEAYAKVKGIESILANTGILGIRRKRKISQEQIDKFVQRVNK